MTDMGTNGSEAPRVEDSPLGAKRASSRHR
jgi:hypothetical protein